MERSCPFARPRWTERTAPGPEITGPLAKVRPVMELCRKNNWNFMIVLLDDSLPSVWAEVHGLRQLQEKNQLDRTWGNRLQHFWWVNEIEYRFGPNHRKRFLVEKHHGYGYEHLFSHDWNATRAYHYLMRIAHTLNILAAYSTALVSLVRELGVRGFIDFVRETMAWPWLDAKHLRIALALPYQLRLE